MTQSVRNYAGEQPKGIARPRNAQKDTNQHACAQSQETVEPACRARAVGHSIENREWRAIAYDDRKITSYRPCAWPECFPDGSPDASEIETVIRSAHQPTVYHRLRTHDIDTQACEESPEQAGVEREAVGTITELHEGERVVWEGQRWSMRVTETATAPDGVVILTGANGGEYSVEGRPTATRPYAIYPGVGIVKGLCRVVADDAQSEIA